MKSSKKRGGGLIILFVLGMSIFGYSQYASASQIEASIIQSELLNENERGSNYDIKVQFENPSLLILTAGQTEFFIIADNETIGEGQLEPFTLHPLDSSDVKGTFYTNNSNVDEEKPQSIKISGVTKYDIFFTSIDVPFVYYPTEEQAREFIHQN